MEEYLQAKLRMFSNMTSRDLAVVPLALKDLVEERGIKASRTYFVASQRFSAPQLPGRHNRENMEAAFLACRFFGVDEGTFQAALQTFVPLPHRLQRVGEKSGVIFVDDSKATTVDALRAALESLDGPIHLLAGGIFKGGDLDGLAPLVKEKVKSVALFGGSRELFEKAFDGVVPVSWDETLREAVFRTALAAVPGDTVLLSAGYIQFRPVRQLQGARKGLPGSCQGRDQSGRGAPCVSRPRQGAPPAWTTGCSSQCSCCRARGWSWS
jgi:UDP-N-acetylmuramoylalanine--D-glutamate ligase